MVGTGRRVGAEEALRMGVCERVVDGDMWEGKGAEGDRALEAAVMMAGEVCEGAPLATGAAGGFFRGEVGEEEAYEEVLVSEDRVEGLRSFKEKRKPVYRGR